MAPRTGGISATIQASGLAERINGTMNTLHYEAAGTFRVTPEALWPLVADTARVNRAIGLPPVEYSIKPAEGGGETLEGTLRLLGLPLARYTEHPFRW